MPNSDAQAAFVRAQRSDVHSLRELILAFPETLARELRWMAPTSFFLVLLILLVYYRRVSYALVALIPFFSGLGLFTALSAILKLQVSFITVIGLVMCFGFSFDYAVFAVDHFAFANRDTQPGVWEAISTAAFATMAGFVPLLFCRHPVLNHLGQALCISTVGCYLGAVWGVPGFMKFVSRPGEIS
jgi:predicted RND superfamily exporter protein